MRSTADSAFDVIDRELNIESDVVMSHAHVRQQFRDRSSGNSSDTHTPTAPFDGFTDDAVGGCAHGIRRRKRGDLCHPHHHRALYQCAA